MITLNYKGTRIRQRHSTKCPYLFTFYANVKEITKWAGIKRTQEQEHGAQRITKPARITAINRFLDVDPINTLPGSIIIGFQDKSILFSPDPNKRMDISNRCNNDVQFGTIEISFDQNVHSHLKPGLIVDGQHRVFGSQKYSEESTNDIPLLIVAILDATIEEQAFQFIVINNQASKVFVA